MTTHAPGGDDWVGLTGDDIPAAEMAAWVVRPDCGAVVTFSGTARDHSPAGGGVDSLEYEAWEDQTVPVMAGVVAEARARWPEVGRIALVHRTGLVRLGESAVVVAVSAPHRVEAFEAARFLIDRTKATAPIWKKEMRAGAGEWVDESLARSGAVS